MIKELVKKNRSYRRFYEGETIERETLRELIDMARLSASAANLQPLKYILSNSSEKNAAVFQNLAWAAYLKDWPGPASGERPSAYIVVLADTAISKNVDCDHGIAAQSILLGAVDMGLGGCILGTINKEGLRKSLEIPSQYKILLVIALGRPKEEVQIERLGADGNVKYWHDEEGVHHVPKRSLEEIILDL